MSTDPRMAGWYAQAERPLYTCIGGPKDGSSVSVARFSGAFEDDECRAAGGRYQLTRRPEGRFTVPVAVWTPKEGQEVGSDQPG